MPYLRVLVVFILGWLLAACQPDSPQEKAGVNTSGVLNYDFTLSQNEFDALSPDDQFVVANKALSTMYRGLPMDEFFDMQQGLSSPKVKYTDFINRTQSLLTSQLKSTKVKVLNKELFGDDAESIPAAFDSLNAGTYPQQVTMAKVLGYPLSKNQLAYWMSYFLANTIMFSPANEMDSTDEQDSGRALAYLELSLMQDKPIREVIKGWLNNLSRWRVSRSAENHALEMFELYLGIFNDTAEEQRNTINGGKACSAWYLTDGNNEYQLKKDPYIDEGVESVEVFSNYISSCAGLYDLVAGHPLLIPRVTEVIVNYFLDGSSTTSKQALIQDIVNTGPETFQEIFVSIIFSEAFLLNSQRVKTFEENAWGFLGVMHYSPRADEYPLDSQVLNRMYNKNSGEDIAPHNMGWAALEYKIGRTPFVPMDSLNFATYHKAIRQGVFLEAKAFDGHRFPERTDYTEASSPREPPFTIKNGAYYVAGTENLKPELDGISVNDFIDFIFLTALGRRAETDERDGFRVEGLSRNFLREYDGVLELRRASRDGTYHEDWTDDFATIMLDYITRLPEFYYYRPVTQ